MAQTTRGDTAVMHSRENQLFDAARTTPVLLLRSMYATHRVLILGFTAHDKTTQYAILDSVFKYVGHDPHLKRIALERPIESAPILEATSTKAIDIANFSSYFSTPDAQRTALQSPEWVYTFKTVMPKIRALNATRRPDNPVLVTTVDGTSGVTAETFENTVEGEQRETATSQHFTTAIWKGLKSTDKIIMLYNMGHVTKTFTVLNTGYIPMWTNTLHDTIAPGSDVDPDELVPSDTGVGGQFQRVPSDWLATFLRDTPNAESQIGVVLLDECIVTGPRVRPVLKFTDRQATRYPHQSFGIALAPFRGVVADSGVSAFVTPRIHPHGTRVHSSSPLPAMYDGVIWLPSAPGDHPPSDMVSSVCQ